jgi:hypothetical protein
MRNEPVAWVGIALVGLVAGLGGPKLLSKAKLAARATGTTYRSGVPSYGKRATADPARGFPA